MNVPNVNTFQQQQQVNQSLMPGPSMAPQIFSEMESKTKWAVENIVKMYQNADPDLQDSLRTSLLADPYTKKILDKYGALQLLRPTQVTSDVARERKVLDSQAEAEALVNSKLTLLRDPKGQELKAREVAMEEGVQYIPASQVAGRPEGMTDVDVVNNLVTQKKEKEYKKQLEMTLDAKRAEAADPVIQESKLKIAQAQADIRGAASEVSLQQRADVEAQKDAYKQYQKLQTKMVSELPSLKASPGGHMNWKQVLPSRLDRAAGITTPTLRAWDTYMDGTDLVELPNGKKVPQRQVRDVTKKVYERYLTVPESRNSEAMKKDLEMLRAIQSPYYDVIRLLTSLNRPGNDEDVFQMYYDLTQGDE